MDDTDVAEEEDDYGDEADEFFLKSRTLLLSFLRQFYCCSGALLLPFFGAVTEQGMLSKYSEEDFELPFLFGEFAGFAFGGIFLSIVGRKLPLIILNLSYLIIISVSSTALFGVERVQFTPMLVGFLLRFATISFIFYIIEISNATLRAFFFGFYYTLYNLGNYFVLTSFIVEMYQSVQVTAILAILSSLASFVVPETPYFLALKGDFEEAENTFTWIRGDNVDTAEYYLMLDKAEGGAELGRIIEGILSSTFVTCIIMSMLLKICNFNACVLYQNLTHHLYVRTFIYFDEYLDMVWDTWMQHSTEITIGSFMFMWISFVIPRKILYAMGFVLTLLLVVPVILTPAAFDTVIKLFPNCFILSYAAREPLALLLPAEILPTIIRGVGLTAVFILEKLMHIFIFYTASSEFSKGYFMFKWPGKLWIFFTYTMSFIGIPFLLIFMPETKDRSIFELEKVTVSFADIFTSENTEESLPE